MKRFKLAFRNFIVTFCHRYLASDIHDLTTGMKIGRGLLIAWKGRIHVIAYIGTPLIPKFIPQQRLTYWKQGIGFTVHPAPDFAHECPVVPPEGRAASGKGNPFDASSVQSVRSHGGFIQ